MAMDPGTQAWVNSLKQSVQREDSALSAVGQRANSPAVRKIRESHLQINRQKKDTVSTLETEYSWITEANERERARVVSKANAGLSTANSAVDNLLDDWEKILDSELEPPEESAALQPLVNDLASEASTQKNLTDTMADAFNVTLLSGGARYVLAGTRLFYAWLTPVSFAEEVAAGGSSAAGSSGAVTFPSTSNGVVNRDGNVVMDGEPITPSTPVSKMEQKITDLDAKIKKYDNYAAGARKAAQDGSLPTDLRNSMRRAEANYKANSGKAVVDKATIEFKLL